MDDEGDEGDDDGDADGFGSEVTFTVTVTKAGESLVFDCASDGTYVDVRHVAHEPAGGADSETAYTGALIALLTLRYVLLRCLWVCGC
jgi:hypothetical protein